MLPLPLRKVKHKAKANHHGTRILRMTTLFCCHSVSLGLFSLMCGRWEQIPPIAKSSVCLLFLFYSRYVCQLMEVTCNECTLLLEKLEWECNCVYEKVHNVHSFIN